MKRILVSISIMLLLGGVAKAQLGVGTTTPDASSVLDVKSTTKGLLPPRMTQAQRTAISTPATGLVVFQTDGTIGLKYYDGSAWVSIQVAQVGDIKTGFQATDHYGWIKLDGRALTTLTATQQAQAASLGIAGNLPNATDKVLKQKSGGINTTSGANTATIAQTNLPNINLTAQSAGGHTHDLTVKDVGYSNGGGSMTVIDATAAGSGYYSNTGSVATSGSHTHTVPLGGSGTALNIENQYLSVNVFIYLGN